MHERFNDSKLEQTGKETIIFSKEKLRTTFKEIRGRMTRLETNNGIPADKQSEYDELDTFFKVMTGLQEYVGGSVPETWEEAGLPDLSTAGNMPIFRADSYSDDGWSKDYEVVYSPADFIEKAGLDENAVSDTLRMIRARMPQATPAKYDSTPKTQSEEPKPKYDPETDPFKNLGKSTAKPRRKWTFGR